jgi:hypothetical protein
MFLSFFNKIEVRFNFKSNSIRSPSYNYTFYFLFNIKATLDDGSRSKVQWNRTILLVESHKLDPWPLDEGPKLKSGKLKLKLQSTNLEGKSIGLDPKKTQNTHNLENQDAR